MYLIKNVSPSILIILFLQLIVLNAQGQGLSQMNQANANQALIRIAEPGQLADTLNVWGDVGTTGRYLIPRSTTLLELISYAGGFGRRGSGSVNASPFTKVNMRVTISRYNEEQNREVLKHFSLKYRDPVPPEFRHYELANEDVVALQVKQKPGFLDILGVVGTILGTATTSYFFYDRILR